METLGKFLLNAQNKFLTFFYKKKRITLRDFTMESCTKVPSSENIDEELPYGSFEDLEGEIKNLNKLLTNKDKEIVQNQKNLESQDSKVYQMQQQIK